MAVGPFLHILEDNPLKVVDPAIPPSKTRDLAWPFGSVKLRAIGGCWLWGGNSGFRGSRIRL